MGVSSLGGMSPLLSRGTSESTTSILAPGIKLVGLVLLCLSLSLARGLKFRTTVYRIIQICDPWNMLPVTLLALVVAIAELGQVATVHPGPGGIRVCRDGCADNLGRPNIRSENPLG